MEVQTLTTLIGSLGFPIVCVIGCGWFIKYMYDAAREDVRRAQLLVEDMVAKFTMLSESINHNTEALKNQTLILTQLVEKVGGIE